MGEDYLFPEEYFVSLRLPQAAERAVLRYRPSDDTHLRQLWQHERLQIG